MRRVNCCDLNSWRWEERSVMGEPPTNAHARRGLDCFVDGRRLIVFGETHTSSRKQDLDPGRFLRDKHDKKALHITAQNRVILVCKLAASNKTPSSS